MNRVWGRRANISSFGGTSFAIMIFLLFAFFSISCLKKTDEREPQNNNPKTAQLISSNQEITATYYSSSGIDKDYYMIYIEKEAAISAELSQVKGVDTKISLYNKVDNEIGTDFLKEPLKVIDDNRESLGEAFAPIKVKPPMALILVEPKRAVNQAEYKKLVYKLKVSLLYPPKPLEDEPNDSFARATIMTEDHITGFYNSGFDSSQKIERDFYKYSLTEDKRYRLKFSLSGVSGVDADLRIFNSRYELLKKIDEGGVGQGEEFSSLGLDGPQDIYIQVYAKEQRFHLHDYYELKIEKIFHDDDHEFEPNDVFDKATAVKQEKIYADISDKNDVDFFYIKNEKEWPQKYVIEVIPDGGVDLKLELFNETRRNPLIFNDGDLEKNEGVSNFILPSQKGVYLKVSAVAFKGSRFIPYQLKVEPEDVVELHEVEPNDTARTAHQIQVGANIIGYINPNNDVDFFKPVLEKKGNYIILVEGIKSCKIKVDITDSAGAIVTSKSAAKLGGGVSLHGQLGLNSLLRVSCPNATANLYKSPYTLSISAAKE